MKETFIYSLTTSMKLSTAVAAVGVIVALTLVGRGPVKATHQPRVTPATEPSPAPDRDRVPV